MDNLQVPVFVAQRMGFFKEHGIDLELAESGAADTQQLLIAKQVDIADMGPLDAAELASQDLPLSYFSTAGAINMINGVAISASDAKKYSDLTDLTGHKLGIPGLGSGTWTAFAAIAQEIYNIDDPKSAFELVTAEPSALLALLAKGDIDGALLFSGQTATAKFETDHYSLLMSFSDVFKEKYGVPLPVTGWVATRDWISSNSDAIERMNAALDEAVDWIIANPDAFRSGGKFEDLAEGAGWGTSEEVTNSVLSIVTDGGWFLKSPDYTDDFRKVMLSFANGAQGVLVDREVTADELFG